MCPDHWKLVPAAMREALACGDVSAVPPPPDWQAIAQAAVAAVAHRESRARPPAARHRPVVKPVQLALFDLPAE